MKFLKSVKEEMQQTTWTKSKDVNKYTLTVVTAVLLVTGYFAIVDTALDAVFKAFIR
ncbi:MAG: preprotein translocase subunit SecE [Bavariicoccus seileri]|uniref:preprotein translocase subunit SecE n=1 Tax=Bavariicoccus seileri TaxID=549685 RepID=UPI003F98B14C